MPELKLTSKRPVTFPKETCEILNVGPGDTIDMELATVDGKRV